MPLKRCPDCRGAGFHRPNLREDQYQTCKRCEGTGTVGGDRDIPPANRAAVTARSGGVCEVCHRRPATDKHHRRFRSRGVDHSVENLLDLCGPGNVFGCHGDAHGLGAPAGVVISQWDARSPAEIPFTDALGYEWRLSPDGTKVKVR